MGGMVRYGDQTEGTCDYHHECCPHHRNGIIDIYSSNVKINGLGAVMSHANTDGDCRCPHGGRFRITQYSATVRINGRPAARIGDETTCVRCGQKGRIISCSGNVFCS